MHKVLLHIERSYVLPLLHQCNITVIQNLMLNNLTIWYPYKADKLSFIGWWTLSLIFCQMSLIFPLQDQMTRFLFKCIHSLSTVDYNGQQYGRTKWIIQFYMTCICTIRFIFFVKLKIIWDLFNVNFRLLL